MKYLQIEKGIFLERPNRFTALVEMDGRTETCHVKNTGRCRELLLPGAEVWLDKSSNPNRKTAYDLVSVRKGDRIINMDSQAPNRVVSEWLKDSGNQLFSNVTYVKPECRYGESRIDFYVETECGRRIFLEVKGVTLEEEGIARFPDAPTERGIRHIRELQRAVAEGCEACILFVIQMKGIRRFEPNDRTHPQFKEALREACREGVKALAYDCQVTPEEMRLDLPVAVRL